MRTVGRLFENVDRSANSILKTASQLLHRTQNRDHVRWTHCLEEGELRNLDMRRLDNYLDSSRI